MSILFCQYPKNSSSQAPAFKAIFPTITKYGPVIVACLLLGLTNQACIPGIRISPAGVEESVNTPLLTVRPELAWQKKLSTSPAALASVGSNLLLVMTYQGEMLSFDLDSGDRRGRMGRTLDEPITTHLVSEQGPYVFIASAWDERLLAYILTRSRVLWNREATGITGRLSLVGDLLLTSSLTSEVTAYRIADGQPVWQTQLQGRIYRGTWDFGDRILVLNDKGDLYALPLQNHSNTTLLEEATERSDGDYPLLWQRRLPINSTAVVGADSSLLVVGDSDGRLLLIDPIEGEILVQIQLAAPIYSEPLVTNELVVVATAAGEIVAVSRSDGLLLWRVQDEGLVRLPLLGIGRQTSQAVLVPFARGRLLAIELTAGHELWHYDLESPIENAALTPDGVAVATRDDRIHYFRSAISAAGDSN